MKDVTSRYLDMLNSFSCDFSLACDKESSFTLFDLQYAIDEKSNFILLNDIRLLIELSFNLRNGFIKIVEE